ncbi:PilN domain-containing protein [Dyella sp.]|jgi:general secretion pathway protein L|uniref:PilN domain-containing protein n=1 Tax=Dyella sp. TaxID=1869338 RepID=UPI002D7A0681|nr:PilN domain-containing protein [Dyella sp.]HET6431347.1 PilN domain-containing protein [Dyella sp.]
MNTTAQSMRPLLDRLRRAWRSSPLPSFLAWWGGELRALLPAAMQQALDGGTRWHLLELRQGNWWLRPAGQPEPLAHWPDAADPALQQQTLRQALAAVDPQDLRLALCLSASAGLRRTITLPLAARDNLAQVVTFEIDRQTPFRAEQVVVDVRELAQGAGEGRFAVELIALPRSTLDPLLERLAALRMQVDAVDLAAGDGRVGANLLPPAQRPRRRDPRRQLNLALAAACVVLAALALGQWLHNRQLALAAMQAQVEAMRGEAQQVAALRQQLQDNAGAAGFLAQKKKDSVPVLALLLDMTRRLPDTAWLERFSLDASGAIGFQGQSVQAAKLVDALKDSPLIRDVGFQGSIQPDPGTGKERFYMVGKVRTQAPAAATAPAPSGSAP